MYPAQNNTNSTNCKQGYLYPCFIGHQRHNLGNDNPTFIYTYYPYGLSRQDNLFQLRHTYSATRG